MANKRVGGIIEVKANGGVLAAKGAFTYNLGRHKRTTILGHDTAHGYTETPQTGFIEGATTDNAELSLENLVTMKDVTVTLTLANGKIIVLRDAIFTGDGTGNTEEGEIDIRFEGKAEEVR